jgi:hypothetical protein
LYFPVSFPVKRGSLFTSKLQRKKNQDIY